MNLVQRADFSIKFPGDADAEAGGQPPLLVKPMDEVFTVMNFT